MDLCVKMRKWLSLQRSGPLCQDGEVVQYVDQRIRCDLYLGWKGGSVCKVADHCVRMRWWFNVGPCVRMGNGSVYKVIDPFVRMRRWFTIQSSRPLCQGGKVVHCIEQQTIVLGWGGGSVCRISYSFVWIGRWLIVQSNRSYCQDGQVAQCIEYHTLLLGWGGGSLYRVADPFVRMGKCLSVQRSRPLCQDGEMVQQVEQPILLHEPHSSFRCSFKDEYIYCYNKICSTSQS